MPLDKYPADAIERARQGSLEWLEEHGDGFPRSWEQEAINDERRGWIMYDEFEAPPIAGYEVLERDGLVDRVGLVERNGQHRVHFRLKS